jgi:hypothetical protein
VIKVKYSSVDGGRSSRPFKSLKGARKFAQRMIGKNPEMGSTYAVSGDGIGKIQVEGCALAELFGDEKPTEATARYLVVNENALCYRIEGSILHGVLAGSVLRGGPDPMTGTIAVAPSDVVRPATVEDFAFFRVSPKGHLT